MSAFEWIVDGVLVSLVTVAILAVFLLALELIK